VVGKAGQTRPTPAKATPTATTPAKATPTTPAKAASAPVEPARAEAIATAPVAADNNPVEASRAEKATSAKKASPAAKTARTAKAAPETRLAAAGSTPAAETTAAETTAAATTAPLVSSGTSDEVNPETTRAAGSTPPLSGAGTEQGSPVGQEAGSTEPALRAGSTDQDTDLWVELVADPGHAPELLAVAAVRAVGPRAREWVSRARDAYPSAPGDALARLAARQFTRAGRLRTVAGAIAGSYAPTLLLGTSAFTHAELILHVAAAYGQDPTDPRRAAELLVIMRVHATMADAEAALAGPAYETRAGLWRLGRLIAGRSTAWSALRLANRYFPGTTLLAAFLTSSAEAEATAARAVAFYRKAATPR